MKAANVTLSWATCRSPAAWTRTLSAASAGSWARTSPTPLTAASNLAADLRQLGDVQAAGDLDQDTPD